MSKNSADKNRLSSKELDKVTGGRLFIEGDDRFSDPADGFLFGGRPSKGNTEDPKPVSVGSTDIKGTPGGNQA